jgi:hypothetical protein
MSKKTKVETIYPSGDRYEACGWITYPQDSVLAGQSQEIPVDWFDSLEAAIKAYPKAVISDGPRCRDHRPEVSQCPPSDFDYLDAGEYWSENDY